jgi:hypothetical protein
MMKKLSSKSQMDIWWQRIAAALAVTGGISATYSAWFELPGIKSDNKDFKEELKNQSKEYNRRFDTSITLGVSVPIAVSLVIGAICLLSHK